MDHVSASCDRSGSSTLAHPGLCVLGCAFLSAGLYVCICVCLCIVYNAGEMLAKPGDQRLDTDDEAISPSKGCI